MGSIELPIAIETRVLIPMINPSSCENKTQIFLKDFIIS